MVPARKIVPNEYGREQPERSHRPELARDAQQGAARVAAPVRRQANLFVVLPLVGLLLLGAGLVFVGQRVQMMTLTYELDAARQQLVRLQQQQARLLVAVAAAASLDKMESTARTRLGLVEPGAVKTVVLTPDETTTAVAWRETPPSTLATLGAWLHERLTTTAEAGERRP